MSGLTFSLTMISWLFFCVIKIRKDSFISIAFYNDKYIMGKDFNILNNS